LTLCGTVTPGHDFDDFACGVRHNLPRVNLLRNDGTLNQHGLHFQVQLSLLKLRESFP